MLEKNATSCPDIGYKVFSLAERPKLARQDGAFRVENERKETADTLYNMLCATGKPLHAGVEELVRDKLYRAGGELYVTGDIDAKQLEEYEDAKINVDGYADISLENWLNLDAINRKNVFVVYSGTADFEDSEK